MKWISISLILLLGSLGSVAQPIGTDLLVAKEPAQIPFSLQQGLIIVDIKLLNVLPLKFIFDTGAENTVLFHKEYSDLIGLPYQKRVKVLGSDFSNDLHALISRSVKISLKGARTVTRDILILEKDVYLLQEKLGFTVDGILGGSFFKGMILDIDYKKSVITMSHPSTDYSMSGFEEFDMSVVKNKPYISGEITVEKNRKVNGQLLIDTGAALPFLIHSNTDSLLTMPDMVINGNLGHGIGGELVGFVGKIQKLGLGKFEYRNMLTSFQDISFLDEEVEQSFLIRNGLLGNTFLSRFAVRLDYLRGKLFLKALKKYNKSFDFDRSGLTIYAFGPDLNQFIIKNVLMNSPAAKAGLKEGDIILKICRKKNSAWTLERLNKLLQRKEGTKIKMIIERDGKMIEKQFKLRDLFKDLKKV